MGGKRKLHFELLLTDEWQTLTDQEVLSHAYSIRYANYMLPDKMWYRERWWTYREIFEAHGLTTEEVLSRNATLIARLNKIEEERRNRELATTNDATRIARPRQTCAVCGAPAELAASRGPACYEHYDDLSD